MRKTILTYGLILGAIIAINMIVTVGLCYSNPDFVANDVVGYASMIVVFSLIFIGVRNYRNKRNNGVLTFGRAFKIGALIALIGATIYVITWLICYYCFVPDFMDKYVAVVMKQASLEGATAAELTARAAEMEQFKELYKNPFFVIIMTYAEVLPVGLVVALISALILKRKPKADQPVAG